MAFDAEEALSRGDADRALVLASRAVKEQPGNLAARSVLDRARKAALRGRRRERLESRVKEAGELADRGDFAGAERIVTSALKLAPDHAGALQLFGTLKERRLGAQTAEAEAERELERMARGQARVALDRARAALTAGNERGALMTLRRGLRAVPGDPELLAAFGEMQRMLARQPASPRAPRADSRVQAAVGLLKQGEIDASLKSLRGILREDPDNAGAQAAVQDVRRAWLTRTAQAAAPRAEPPAPSPVPRPEPAPPAKPPVIAPRSVATTPATRPSVDTRALERPSPRWSSRSEGARLSVPEEVLLPRARRTATPLGVVLVCAVALLSAIGLILAGRGGPPAATRAPTTVPAEPPMAPPSPQAPTGPLASASPDLRYAIETTLRDYARALEAGDAQLLAQVRPDLTQEQRARILAPFVGALNAATDLRVLDVIQAGDIAKVPVLRTDVIVGGSNPVSPPVEETLTFQRGSGSWVLR